MKALCLSFLFLVCAACEQSDVLHVRDLDVVYNAGNGDWTYIYIKTLKGVECAGARVTPEANNQRASLIRDTGSGTPSVDIRAEFVEEEPHRGWYLVKLPKTDAEISQGDHYQVVVHTASD